jgi:hypothetical protein
MEDQEWQHLGFELPTYALSFYLQVPKKFGLVQIFCARLKIDLHIVPNFFCQTKR